MLRRDLPDRPIHPNRGFGGKEQVRKNWSSMFESFSDFEAQLLRHATDEGTAWSEWHWRATGIALNEGRETAKMIQGF